MKYFFGLLLLFMIGAVAGWCIELVYRRFVSSKKWINPGFLSGPYLPLYGFGACLLYGICSIPMPLWAQIIFIVVMMTVIEYAAGLIFIKGMHIQLWDYSKEWGNLQGIICPLYSLFWGILGVLFLFFLYPAFNRVIDWLDATPYFLFAVGLFYGVVAVDVGASFNFALRIKRAIGNIKEAVRYEELKRRIRIDRRSEHKRSFFWFPFKTDKPLHTYIADMIREKAVSRRAAHKTTEPENADGTETAATPDKTDSGETSDEKFG